MPSKVLIFRTGITDNLTDATSHFEVEKFNRAWNRYFERNTHETRFDASVLYINVERNHKIRFRQEWVVKIDANKQLHRQHTSQSDYGRRDENAQKGTVVDSSLINSPSGNGFYLISHKGLLGTSRPAYYEIKHNNWNVDPRRLPDELQVIWDM